MTKALISVTGLDATGIIARVATKLSELNINILDISQTILQGYFNMMMITDMTQATKPFGEISDELSELGKSIGVIIKCQREEIFNSMHRI